MKIIHPTTSSKYNNTETSTTHPSKRSLLKAFAFTCLLTLCCSVEGLATAFIYDDFETYSAGVNLSGTGGWSRLSGSGITQITPTGGGNNLEVVLQGNHSAGFTSATGLLGKSFANSVQNITVQGTTLEMTSLFRAVGGLQTFTQYLMVSNTPATIAGGIEMNGAALSGAIYIYGKKNLGAVDSYNTGYTYAADTTYSTRFLMDFSSDTFQAFYQDVSNSGSEIELTAGGIFAFDPTFPNLTLADILGSGGMAYGATTGVNQFYLDGLTATTVPEPRVTVLLFMAAGVLFLLRNRR